MAEKQKVKYMEKHVSFGGKKLTLYSIDGLTWSSRKDELLAIRDRQEAARLALQRAAILGTAVDPAKAEAAKDKEGKEEDEEEEIVEDDDLIDVAPPIAKAGKSGGPKVKGPTKVAPAPPPSVSKGAAKISKTKTLPQPSKRTSPKPAKSKKNSAKAKRKAA